MRILARASLLTRCLAVVLVFGAGLAAVAPALASSALPDGRAWELVSPSQKNSGNIVGPGEISGGGLLQASPDGEAITYVSRAAFENPLSSPIGNQYVSKRGEAGWVTQNIDMPSSSDAYGNNGGGAPYRTFSIDLSKGLLLNGGGLPVEAPVLVPGIPQGYQNYYLIELSKDGVEALLTRTPGEPPEGPSEFSMSLQGATPDLNHVVVATRAALTPAAVGGSGENLYEWGGGELRPINVLPEVGNGATSPRSRLGSGEYEGHTISSDGSRIFWSPKTTADAPLYVREEGKRTIRLDVAQSGAKLEEGEVPEQRFQTASSDGSSAYFTSRAPLTEDANTGPGCKAGCARPGNDLYQAELGGQGSIALTDLTPDHRDVNGAEVQGVLGASESGPPYVYFVAKGILTKVPNSEGRSPTPGEENLYVTHEGHTAFIATLSPSDEAVWSRSVAHRTTRITPDGTHLVFVSSAKLTGYDNLDAKTGLPDQEVYVYDATLGALRCVSCNPEGVRPVGSSWISAGTDFTSSEGGRALYDSRVLSVDASRVFFDSTDALVPQDINGVQDVYEYENGQVYLISSGTGVEGASFVDASESGNDVFFVTRQRLVASDTDELVDLYDARVGGGFPEPLPARPLCEEHECGSPKSTPPVFGTPASAAFVAVEGAAPAVHPPAPKPKGHARKSNLKRHKKRLGHRKKKGRSRPTAARRR
jgi:hypothetical protein